jgi:electron transfer flavoprotein alpha subunit
MILFHIKYLRRLMMPEGPKDIWVFAEFVSKGLPEFVLELASEGRRLADKLGERLCAAIIAGDPNDIGESLSQYGVDIIYHAKAADLAKGYIPVLSRLVAKYTPRLLLVGATPTGSELAIQIAARNKLLIVTHCLILGVNDRGFFEATKMIYGDKVYVTIETPISKGQVISVVPGAFDLKSSHAKKPAQLVVEPVEHAEIDQFSHRIKYLEVLKGDPEKIDIGEAEIIVAGGKGVGSRDGFKKIESLAKELGGGLAGSRAAVDQGWLPFERQIGQTGVTVSPKLFVSCGISGAFEFTAGMKDSRLIVSINNDPKAPIFRISNLSLVGDLHTVVLEIIKQLEKYSEEIK